jgi:hypothetical protein
MIDQQILNDAYAGVGSAPHPPECMLRMVLYELLDGRPSPAQWHRDARCNDALKYLGRMIEPCRTACYNFRDRAERFIQQAHDQLLGVALDEKLLDSPEGVLDGTQFRACASRHRMLNQEQLNRRIEQLQTTIRQGSSADDIPAWMAKTVSGRTEQLQRYEKAAAIVAARLAANAKKNKDKRLPEKRVLVSPSDPEAPIGRDKEKVFGPIYNAQYMVDPATHLILAVETFAQTSDVGTLIPMVRLTRQNVGESFHIVHADCAYCSLLDLRACEQMNVDLRSPVQENGLTEKKKQEKKRQGRLSKDDFVYSPEDNSYICPQGHRLKYTDRSCRRRHSDQFVVELRYRMSPEVCQVCPVAQNCLTPGAKARMIKRLEGQEILDAQRENMKTDIGLQSRRIRGQTVERAFADVKQHRKLRQLHCRTLRRAKVEIHLHVLAQNALTLFRVRMKSLRPEKELT